MRKRLAEAEHTIKDPNVICKAANNESRFCYYRLNSKTNLYMKVVTEFEFPEDYQLITAYPAANMKEGEVVLWLKKF